MRILVAGAGSIGQRHIRVIKDTGNHEIVVCDSDIRNLETVSKEYGIKECYIDFKEALSKNIQAVVVCTPNSLHAPMCIEAMSKGCHVLVEKPMTNTVEDAEKIVAASKRYGRIVMVAYILRVYPGVEDIKKTLEEELFGRVVSARVKLSAPGTLTLAKSDYRKSYETGGGIIYDYSHEVDYLRYFFGEASRYACFKDSLVKMDETCDDIAEIIIQYKNSVIANIHMDYIQEYGNSGRNIEIIFENGVIEYNFGDTLVMYDSNGCKKVKNYTFKRDDMFLKQFNKFINVCNGNIEDYVNAEDGLAVVKLCEEFYRSDREGIVILRE